MYVAGRFTEPEPVRALQAALRARGALVTADWTVDAAADTSGRTAAQFLDDMPAAAKVYLDGVAAADVVVALFTDSDPAYPYAGTTCELTAARLMNKPIVRIVPPSVFAALAALAAACHSDECAAPSWTSVASSLPTYVKCPFWHPSPTQGRDGKAVDVLVDSEDEAVDTLERWWALPARGNGGDW